MDDRDAEMPIADISMAYHQVADRPFRLLAVAPFLRECRGRVSGADMCRYVGLGPDGMYEGGHDEH